jgi:DNA-binding beta-propeller fold protein YncE
MRWCPLLAALAACAGNDDGGAPPGGGAASCEPEVDRICPFAGTGLAGFNGEDLPALDTMMYFPMDITFSPYGKPVYADWNNHKLRMLEDDGTVRTIMGTNFIGDGDDLRLDLSLVGADGLTVNLNHPTQQRYFSDGVLLSASWHTHKLRTWDPETGLVHVLVGQQADFVGDHYESAGTARFNQPVAVEIDSKGDVYVVDMRNERVRHLRMSDFTINTLVGTGDKDYCGDGGEARDACLSFPLSDNPEPGGALAFSADERLIYIADTENQVIRVYDTETGVVDLYAGAPLEPGDVDGDRLSARFAMPRDLVMSPEGLLFVADSDNSKIRVIDTSTGEVSTFAGTGEPSCPGDGPQIVPRTCDEQLAGASGDGGNRLDARLYRPFGVELDLDGNLVVADTFSHRFRIIYRFAADGGEG